MFNIFIDFQLFKYYNNILFVCTTRVQHICFLKHHVKVFCFFYTLQSCRLHFPRIFTIRQLTLSEGQVGTRAEVKEISLSLLFVMKASNLYRSDCSPILLRSMCAVTFNWTSTANEDYRLQACVTVHFHAKWRMLCKKGPIYTASCKPRQQGLQRSSDLPAKTVIFSVKNTGRNREYFTDRR